MKPILLLISVLCLLLIGCGKSGEGTKSETKPPEHAQAGEAKAADNLLHIKQEMLRDLRITTTKVEQRQSGDGVNLLGEITVNEGAYSQVGVPVASRVVKLIASSGQSVKRGDELAVVQSTELGKARSDSISAEARLQLAQQTLERKKKLAAERIAAQREVQEAEANVASAEADLRASKATLRALGAGDSQSDSSLLVLRAPISGTIIERNALNGQLVEPAQPIFKIADLTNLWLVVHAFERDAVRLQSGTSARVSLPAAPGQKVSGRVVLIGKEVDPASRTIAVRIAVSNSGGILRPGMSANAWVPFGAATEQIIAVPAASVQRLGEDWLVFIPKSEDTFEIRKVGRGRDLGGEIEILNGLQAGETVVVDGAYLLKAEAEKSRSEGQDHD